MSKFHQTYIIPADSQLLRHINNLKNMSELLQQKISQAQTEEISPKDKFEIRNDYHLIRRYHGFLKLLVEHSEKSQTIIAANFR